MNCYEQKEQVEQLKNCHLVTSRLSAQKHASTYVL